MAISSEVPRTPAALGSDVQPPAGSESRPAPGTASRRHGLFALLFAASLVIFWASIATLVHDALWSDNFYDKYSYTPAIPFITAVLIFSVRKRIYSALGDGWAAGLPVLLAALGLSGFASWDLARVGDDVFLSLKIAALVAFWMGAFIVCYGTRSFRAAAFPLLFLFLSVPIPDALLDKPVTAVQYGSTQVCAGIFTLVGIPFVRDGFQFALSSVTIEVAKECSGIHSTIAIVIVSLLASYLFLSSNWKKLVLLLCALPIVCLTNGFRIAGLTLLSIYVNPGFLHGDLHRKGGVFFFLLALLLLFGLLRLLLIGQSAQPAGLGKAQPTE